MKLFLAGVLTVLGALIVAGVKPEFEIPFAIIWLGLPIVLASEKFK